MRDRVHIQYHRGKRIAGIEFTFPDRNTFTLPRVASLVQALLEVAQNRTVRCVVFSSGTEGYFSDGYSLDDMLGAKAHNDLEDRNYERYEGVVELYRQLIRTQIPTVSVVDGVCRGAGLEWALATDFIVATPRATFSLHEVRLGLVPGLGGMDMFARRVHPNRAAYVLLSAPKIGAHDANNIGLVDALVADLDQAIHEFVTPIAKRPRSALIRMKSFLGNQQHKLNALSDCHDPFIQCLHERDLNRTASIVQKGETA